MSDNQTIPIRRTTVPVPDFVAQSMVSSQPKQESKYPTEMVPLPTKGWFYPDGDPLSLGEIEIKQMSAREEDILANQDLIKKGKVLDKLLESLVVNKSIDIDKILIPDKNAIFISIRRLAYGDEYPVKITCPQCSAQNNVSINLSELVYKPFDFENLPRGENSFLFELPFSKIQITYKILNQLDEKSIETELDSLKKINKDVSRELTTRLIYLITSVGGNPDKNIIRKFVNEQLTARDSQMLRKYTNEHNPNVDMTFNFVCNDCNLERKLVVPIGANFLWPDLDA